MTLVSITILVMAMVAGGHADAWGKAPPQAPRPYYDTDHPKGGAVAGSEDPTGGAVSPELWKKWEARLAAQYDYEIRLMEYNLRIFEWQRTASTVLLLLVGLLVVAGVGFAGFQLWHATFSKAARESGSSTDLELSMQKVKVTSSVVGVVVLVLSLAFVYLFLHEVYTMKPAVDTIAVAPASKNATATSGKTEPSTSSKPGTSSKLTE
jgi:hypothetical protein